MGQVTAETYSLNILVHDGINLYYEHWKDRQKHFYYEGIKWNYDVR